MAIKTCTGTTGRAYVHVEIRQSQSVVVTATGADVPMVQSVTGDVNGAYTFTAWAAGDLTPTGTYNIVTEYLGPTDNTFNIQVPQTAGPFPVTTILVGTPSASPSPNHVSTLIVDSTAAVGSLTVTAGEPGIDTAAAGVLEIGGDNATSVEIGPANVLVDASGNVAGRSFTASSNSPNTSDFPAGATNILTDGTSSRVYDKGGAVFNVAGPKYRNIGTWDPVAGTGDATAAAVQAYTDAAGAEVYWPSGTFVLKTASAFGAILTLTTPKVRSSGAGPNSVLKLDAASANGSIIFLVNAADCEFDGLAFDANTVTTTRHIKINGVARTKIHDCTFTKPIGRAIELFGASSKTSILANDFDCTTGGYGVLWDAASTDTGTRVEGNGFDMGSAGYDAVEINTPTGGASGFVVSENVILASGGTTGFGIGIAHGVKGSVLGNQISGMGQQGIHIEDGSADLIISKNIVSGCLKEGIVVDSSNAARLCRDLSIDDNSVDTCSLGTGTSGIGLVGTQYAKAIRIRGNRVHDCGPGGGSVYGIDLGYGANDSNHYMVTDNIVTNTSGATQTAGIRVNGSLFAEIRGNVCYDDQAVKTQMYGLLVVGAGGARLTVEDNDFRGNLTAAVSDVVSVDTVYRNNRGYNPIGNVAPPALAATGVVLGNPFKADSTWFIAGGTLTAIGVGGLPKVGATGALTATPVGTGGTLTNNTTYNYRVTALNALGETAVSFLLSPTTPAGPNTCSVRLDWTPIPGASGYHVYGRTGGILRIGTNIQAFRFIDDGSVTPAGATPGGDTTGNTATGITAAAPAGSAHAVRVPWGSGLAITYSVAPTVTVFLD